jgi:nucleotidyltransferase AbiEii toxin of type IV toxin-antitoxin system
VTVGIKTPELEPYLEHVRAQPFVRVLEVRREFGLDKGQRLDAMLTELQRACQEVHTQAVIVGAMAYRIWVRDLYRTTEDLDFAVALDLEELSKLTDRLQVRGWRQNPSGGEPS